MSAHRWIRFCELRFLSNSATATFPPFAPNRVIKMRRFPWRTAESVRKYCHRGEDVLKHRTVQKYLERLLDEHGSISKSLQTEAVGDSDRKNLNRRLVELSSVANTFLSCEAALKELGEVETLLQSECPPVNSHGLPFAACRGRQSHV